MSDTAIIDYEEVYRQTTERDIVRDDDEVAPLSVLQSRLYDVTIDKR